MTTRSQTFTVNGTFTVPTGVTSVWLTMVGGGGGGGPATSNALGTTNSGAGGGAGEFCRRHPLKVTSGDAITVVIGVGGTSTYNAVRGVDGTATSFGAVSCQGGNGGSGALVNSDPNKATSCQGGGSGGGQYHPANVNWNDVAAVNGSAESATFFGGASGGGGNRSNASGTQVGRPGASCEPYLGGLGGIGPTFFCSGGGGASCFGPGGAGGASNGNGQDAPADAYGAGGGGAGEREELRGSLKGGVGRNGFCLVEWVG